MQTAYFGCAEPVSALSKPLTENDCNQHAVKKESDKGRDDLNLPLI